MNAPNAKVDWYFEKADKWQLAVKKLREIILKCGLIEELKRGCPCYTLEGGKIVLIHRFKEYCAVLFFKGVLLVDPRSLLIQQTKNVQSARQIRFSSLEEIEEKESVLKEYMNKAIEVEKAGLEVDFKATTEFEFCEEFTAKLDDVAGLKAAFDDLTPGRQRGYLLYFSSAKQSKTRVSRIEKCIYKIMDGKGLED